MDQRRYGKHKYEFAVEERMIEFRVHPRSKFDQTPPVLRKPLYLGDFSLDGKRKFCHDKRNLSYINVDFESSKQVEYDLNVAMDRVTRKNYDEMRRSKVDHILHWLLLNRQKFHTEISAGKALHSLSTDFICYRGLLRDILSTPYEGREGWIICATKFRGTIYLCLYETPEKFAQRESETDIQKTMCSWGYKFEQYMTVDSDISEPVNENVEYAVVMRSRLGDHSLVYCAEVDGVDPKKYRTPHSDLSAFVELKTNKSLDTDRDIFNLHKYKMMKWWGQSYLVGIPTVICGFRDSSGIVHSLKAFQVDSLPSVGKEHWKPQIMKYFLSDFLAFIKKQVLIDDPKVVYKFERKANGGHIICKYLGKDPNWSFLPQWYYKEIFQTQTELSK